MKDHLDSARETTKEHQQVYNFLPMYSLDRGGVVSYESYLKSKKIYVRDKRLHDNDAPSLNDVEVTKIEIRKNAGLVQAKSSMLQALENEDIEVQRAAASLQNCLLPADREEVAQVIFRKVLEALNNQNIEIARIGANMIQYVSEKEVRGLQMVLYEKIMTVFKQGDIVDKKTMAKKVSLLDSGSQEILYEEVVSIIEAELKQPNLLRQRVAATMIPFAPKIKQPYLELLVSEEFVKAVASGRAGEIIETPLYLRHFSRHASDFARKEFSKTGSGTTLLLGDKFKGNIIFRHFEQACFEEWQKAFESYEIWKANGYDYVPVEPIYSFTQKEKWRN